jgi:penicillin-binding protein 2
MRVGIAFGDHVKTERIPKRKKSQNTGGKMRPVMLLVILLVSCALLVIKLFQLQIVQGAYYKSLSDSNRIRTSIIHAPRGIIFDRNNIPLVFNVPGFRIIEKEKTKLLTNDEALQLISREKAVEVDSLRKYAYPTIFSHVIGYVGQISKEELEHEAYARYQITDVIGKFGIEQFYENLLSGTDGKELIEVDVTGKKVRSLGKTDPVPGHNISLTLDQKLQEAAYAAMDGVEKGAVVVSTPKGEILSMISKPSFDANLFTMGQTYETATSGGYQDIETILTDGNKQPLLNRAIGGVYPPGSTFKLVTAAAGLEDKIITKAYTVEDTGILRVGEFSFGNWYFLEQGGKDGNVNVVKAISRSNDIFFYKLAEKINVDRLSSFAKRFGVGDVLGIDISGEAKGVLPTKQWKQNEIGETWYLGDTYHYGIGQGFLLTTPLQVNAWTQAIANGGTVYVPRLLKSAPEQIKAKDFLNDDTIALIRQGMIDSCTTGGVAFPFFTFAVKNPYLEIDGKNILQAEQASKSADMKDYRKVAVACKTGTAQHGGEETEPHAWITLFAPAYNPEIVVTVLVESGGQGSSVAGPIAKEIVRAWFEN